MREKELEKIEVHVAGICLKDGQVLCAKRTQARKLFPGKWECGGGQVRYGERFEDACKRQFREEFGVMVEPLAVIGTYFIDDGETKIPGLKFLCDIVEEYELKADPGEHDEIRFMPLDAIETYDFIPGVIDDIQVAADLSAAMDD